MKKKKYTKNFESVVVNKRTNWFSKEKILVYCIGGLLIALMVSSMFGGVGSEEEESGDVYNGFKFYRAQGGWATRIDGVDLGFDYAPWIVENITAEEFNLGERVYVMYDPLEMNENTYDVRRTLGFLTLVGKNVNPACSGEEGCGDWPIKNCATDDVVYLKMGGEDRIYNDDKCVVLQGEDLLKVENLFYYKLLGVVK